ncbi:glycosyltransferase family 39 protein [Geobacter argillaceus]|uniref:Dolichyl-phosphate-mannose-protein mannosyltransferase n=1 Tax=Geobacter argillaceus TaxID=345631 RepID=A0A562VN97_9BACT|nr:glycosyltransferase family 39 protein [Geobacter argillaceus]TWJ19379.1 dolichyl-phosphate-mannose-protein mannosyltransferase [Geobacter argillaceus]
MRSWRIDNAQASPLFFCVILTVTVLIVYYPALFGGTISIDDPHIIAHFSRLPPLHEILVPGRSYYYRPVAEFSYYLDSLLWGMEPMAMHLENILFHAANSILVFFLARRIFRQIPEANPSAPLFAALLFALHPLPVEGVSWISGRTDPLAAIFFLSATLTWIIWLDRPSWQAGAWTLFLFLLGVLTKEVAVTFLPLALLLALRSPSFPAGSSGNKRLVAVCAIGALGMSASAIMLLRHGGTGLSRFWAEGGTDMPHSAWNALIAVGFYLKKLFIPMPLNFAITDVSPLYGLLGGTAVLVILGSYRCGGIVQLMFGSVFLTALPAVLVAVRQVAWTPYAERYMYIPVAFLALGMGGGYAALPRRYLTFVNPLLVILLCVAAVVTLQRTILWQNNLALIQDTVIKSPGFGAVHNELGAALMRSGRVDVAAREFYLADRLNRRPSIRMLIKANVMGAMVARQDYSGARDLFFQLFREKRAAPVEFLDLLHKADSMRMSGLSPSDKARLALDVKETLAVLFEKNGDPFWLYRGGQMALAAGKGREAADLFRRAYASAPQDAHYRPAAEKYLTHLEGEP